MSSHFSPADLEYTLIAQWRRRLVGGRSETKSHWRTKTAYYRAVGELLADSPATPLSWRAIVAAVRPKGSRSTFYEVTGPNSKHPLIGDLLAEDEVDSLQLALCYHRSAAVDQLVDETKVWTYWPYRQGWLDQLRLDGDCDADAAARSLVWVVTEWARCNPRLAAALDHSPPACAVEDLLIIQRGQACALRTHAALAQVARDGLSPLAQISGGVADTAWADVNPHRPEPSTGDALLAGLAQRLYALNLESPRLAPADATSVRHAAAELMRDALETV